MNYAEVKETFVGASVVEILTEPGMSILDLAMKAQCFKTERKILLQISK